MPYFGTYFGASDAVGADYPAVSDVRDGVAFDSGNLTGTLVLPDPDDVELGVQYGAGGTEFTGTLAFVPVPAGDGTDYHALVRDAARLTLLSALGADYPDLPVVKVEDPETDIPLLTNLPAVVVACVGPEQPYPAMNTNARDGRGYPVVVMLMTTGVSGGQKLTGVPTMTEFRRLVTVVFNNKRLGGVTQVGWCEVSDSGPLFDKDSPAFQKLQTALVVNAIGRFPRS